MQKQQIPWSQLWRICRDEVIFYDDEGGNYCGQENSNTPRSSDFS
jgi:hypothetical protein